MLQKLKTEIFRILSHWEYRRRQLVTQADLKEILKVSPIKSDPDSNIDVFILTGGHDDLYPLLIALKTFQFWADIPMFFNICCDDGLMTKDDQQVIQDHVHNARFITDRAEILEKLRDYPAITRFHVDAKDPSYPKLSIPALYASRPKVVLMDTDVVFFRQPELLVEWASDLTNSNDYYRNPVKVNTPYPFPKLEEELMSRFNIGERPMLESGLLLFHKDLLDLSTLEYVSDAFFRHGFHQWSKELEIYNVLYRVRGKAQPLLRKDYGGIWTYGASAIHYFSKDMFRPSSIRHISSVIDFMLLAEKEGFCASNGIDR